jgi:hypothetical protein
VYAPPKSEKDLTFPGMWHTTPMSSGVTATRGTQDSSQDYWLANEAVVTRASCLSDSEGSRDDST